MLDVLQASMQHRPRPEPPSPPLPPLTHSSGHSAAAAAASAYALWLEVTQVVSHVPRQLKGSSGEGRWSCVVHGCAHTLGGGSSPLTAHQRWGLSWVGWTLLFLPPPLRSTESNVIDAHVSTIRFNRC